MSASAEQDEGCRPRRRQRRERRIRNPRLYWVMASSFAVVIVLVVCGMAGVLGLTFAGTVPSAPLREGLRDAAASYSGILSDYYVANDGSWSGVEQRLSAPPFYGAGAIYAFTIVDEQGNVIAGSELPAAAGPGTMAERMHQRMGVPIEEAPLRVRGRTVGTLVVQPAFAVRAEASASGAARRPSSQLWVVWRSVLIAGLIFGGMLMALAFMLARRVTRPLQSLTAASEALAEGRLDTRVPGASVRELDELAGAFNRMAEKLSAADAQRRQMTADVAHELRTPMAIIRGRLEGMQDGVYTAEPEQIDSLLHELSLLERLVEDLRLLALADAGQLALYREPTDPRDLVEGAVGAFADEAARHGVGLRAEVTDGLPALDIDPQRIAQVLSNLVGNALRHTQPGGSVVVAARQAPGDDGVRLEVRDSGSGIAPEDLPHVFDRFWRADRSRTRGSGGAGLGLAIVKQIVAAHGGSVRADSAPGQGATFSVTLPVAAPH